MKLKIQAGKRRISVKFPHGTTTSGTFNKEGWLTSSAWKNKEGQGGEECFEAADTLQKLYQWLDCYSALPTRINVEVSEDHIRATFPNGMAFAAKYHEDGYVKTFWMEVTTGVAETTDEVAVDALDNLHGWIMFPQ